MSPKLIITEDGSHSLYAAEFNEHYHSIHGAIQESKHIFIAAGLNYFAAEKQNKAISILEIGLGTGLNVLLTIIENQQLQFNIDYTGLEAFPVHADIASTLNYTDLLVNEAYSKNELQQFFDTIHLSEWNKRLVVTEKFQLTKIKNTLQQVQFKEQFNLIYFDAFGPAAQPEMWTEEMFSKISDAMVGNGILVTYCAKGRVKRTLKKIGFELASLQGPPGKREMIRAVKVRNQ